MFESLGDKLEQVFKRLRGHGKITERHMNEALREIRMALLEADVALPVVQHFIGSRPRAGARPGGAAEPHARSSTS